MTNISSTFSVKPRLQFLLFVCDILFDLQRSVSSIRRCSSFSFWAAFFFVSATIIGPPNLAESSVVGSSRAVSLIAVYSLWAAPSIDINSSRAVPSIRRDQCGQVGGGSRLARDVGRCLPTERQERDVEV
ncbi:hypothetical protein C1H46_044345 [Malus baccata]|uniref:Uncharacterized protein n=1 Tax=Malus baccata TaxID=106549 RepID=A0A540K7C7_MALBA|nr:hypothetical protein C1H46_044345 [Malus baccata]